jgi:Glycosyltransferase family 87
VSGGTGPSTREKARLRAAVLLALLVAAVGLFALRVTNEMADFEVYWRAGQRAAAAEPLYRAEDEHYRLKYLPAFAILAIPIGFLPLTAAKAMWFLMSVALIPTALALSRALLPAQRRTAAAVEGLGLILMAKFYGHELVLGQVNLLLLCVLLAATHLVMRGNHSLAGSLTALAVVVKPYAIIFLPWLAAERAFRALSWAAFGIVTALALPAVLYGVSGAVALHASWWRTVTESTAPNLLNPDNVSLAAMYAKWFGMGSLATTLAAVTSAILLGIAVFVFILRQRVPFPAGLETALLLNMMPLLSPQGWDYVFLLGTPAVVYLVNYDRELPASLRLLTWVALAVVGFTLYDVMGRRAYGRFMAWSAISVCFLVVIGALTTLRMRRVA